MLERIRTFLSRKPPPAPEPRVSQADWVIRTAKLEARIEAIGRDKVFARAESYGWGMSTPPIWVWELICCELETGRRF